MIYYLNLLFFFIFGILNLNSQLGLNDLGDVEQGFGFFMIYKGYKLNNAKSRYVDDLTNNNNYLFKIREKRSSPKDFLLIPEEKYYTGPDNLKKLEILGSTTKTWDFDGTLISRFNKSPELTNKYLHKVSVQIKESNCAYLLGIIVDDSFYAEMMKIRGEEIRLYMICLLYTSPSPRDLSTSRMPSSA